MQSAGVSEMPLLQLFIKISDVMMNDAEYMGVNVSCTIWRELDNARPMKIGEYRVVEHIFSRP